MELSLDNINVRDGYNMEDIARCIYIDCRHKKLDKMPYILTVDGSHIKILDTTVNLPSSWEYQTKMITNQNDFDVVEYYLRDRISDTLYCIFGIDAVLNIFPGITNHCDMANKMYYSKHKVILEDEKTSICKNINITRNNADNKFSTEIIKYSTPITEPIKIIPIH